MDTPFRVTLTTLKVLHALLTADRQPLYGFEIMRLTDLAGGTLYPILHRLEDAGWITGTWEEIDSALEGRPRRCYYRLTPGGRTEALKVIQNFQL